MPTNKELAKLVIKLEADSSTLRRDLQRIEANVSRSSKRMQASFGKMSTATAGLRAGFARVHVGVAALAGASGLGLLIKQSFDFADGIDKASSKLGITTDFLQEARFAADQSGISFQTLEMAIQRVVRRTGDLQFGSSEAQDALAKLGVQVRDDNNQFKTTEVLFREIVKALGEVGNTAERTSLAAKLFDSEGVAVVNLAKNFERLTNEARESGQILSGETIARAVEAKDEISKLSGETKVLATEALVDLAPALLDTAQSLADVAHFAGEAWAGMRDFLNLDPKNIEEARDRIGELKRELASLAGDARFAREVQGGAAFGPLSGGGKRLDVIEADIVRKTQELAAAQRALQELEKRSTARAIPDAPLLDGRGVPQLSKSEQSEVDSREKAIETLRRQTEEQQRLLNAKVLGEEALAREISLIAIENDIRGLGANATAEQIAEVERLAEAREAAAREFGDIEESGVTAANEILGSVERLRDGMGNAFVRMALDGENAFKALGDSFVRDFLSRIVQQKLFNPIFAEFGLDARAAGGPVTAGQPYLVGERGPEIIIPNANSFVVPNHRIGSASAGGTSLGGNVNVYVQNNAGADVGVSESTGPGGSRDIAIAIEQAAGKGLARGALDGPMMSRYGIRPKGRAGA